MLLPELSLRLPNWINDHIMQAPAFFETIEERMRFVLTLSRQNVLNKTGGPFAAVVFDSEGRIIAPGVNIVVTSKCSVFHAEIIALALAQKILGRYDISDGGKLQYDLFATTEPCAMCFGAIPWSGIRRLVCGARDEDARAIGFDEGPKMAEWISALNDRGISVLRDVLRADAAAILKEYAASGGPLYNAGG